jgi:putative DNA primase/helicase
VNNNIEGGHAAQRWFKNGFDRVVPILPIDADGFGDAAGKAPGIKNANGWSLLSDWQNKRMDERWLGIIEKNMPDANVGLLLGHGQVAVDVDIKHEDDRDIRNEVLKYFLQRLGTAPIRYRDNSPSAAILYALDGAPGKCKIEFTTANGHACGIELPARGQQIVVAGRHPSGAELKWHRNEPQAGKLPKISNTEWQDAFGGMHDLLERLDCTIRGRVNGTTAEPRKPVDPDAVPDDPDGVIQVLQDHGLVVAATDEPGAFNLTCPWESEHQTPPPNYETADDDTRLYLPSSRGYTGYGFKCVRGSCTGRTANDVLKLYGLDPLARLGIRVQSRKSDTEKTASGGNGANHAGRADDDTVELAARLDPVEYDRQREKLAERLGCRVVTLDTLVKKVRKAEESTGQGSEPEFDEPEPWPDPVDTADLLDTLEAIYGGYLVLPKHAAPAMALWTLFTWTIDAFDCAPILLISAPERQSGKTKAKEVISKLVKRPITSSSISAAVMFRVIDKYAPTLMVDEADTFLKDNDELRGIINSGFNRNDPVWRAVGDDHEPRCFNTFCPKLLAMIGVPADTTLDRCIIIPMHVRRKLARWADDNLAKLENAEPLLPSRLDDRAQDKWEPLTAIADLAGGTWSEKARKAAVELSALADEDSLGVELLTDIRAVFRDQGDPDAIPTKEMIEHLAALDSRPWASWGRSGKEITAHALGRILKRYKIKPKQRRDGSTRERGYNRSDFEDVWIRYLPDNEGKT